LSQPPEPSPAVAKDRPDPFEDGLAVAILTFLAAEPERLSRFLDLTGLTPATLRAAASGTAFEEALVDHLRTDDRLLLAFASAQGIDPGRLHALYRRVPTTAGGDP
jgi:hypothetical protein